MKINTSYYQQFDADYSLDIPEEGFGGWKEATIDLDPAHTAVVVMHAWDCGTFEQFPGWFRACGEIPRTYRVCREQLPGLLAAVRQAGMTLFHVVAGSGYFEQYAGYQRALALTTPQAPLERIAGDPTYDRLQQFRNEHVFVGAHNQEDADRGWAHVGIAREAMPLGDEGIARDAEQLFALCRAAGVNHLIYAGFNIDWCLLFSSGGMVDMTRRGLICSAFRDAVTAVENKETARHELGKEISLWRVSVGFGFVFDAADFIAALNQD